MQLGLILITLLEDQDRTQIKTFTADSCGGFSLYYHYYYHRQQIADGGQMAKTLGKKKERADALSFKTQPLICFVIWDWLIFYKFFYPLIISNSLYFVCIILV